MRDYKDGYSYYVCRKSIRLDGELTFVKGKKYDIGYSDDEGVGVCGDDEYEIAFLPHDVVDRCFDICFYDLDSGEILYNKI